MITSHCRKKAAAMSSGPEDMELKNNQSGGGMKMQGKLIIIEAGDGSGKATQTKLLYDALIGMGKKCHEGGIS